MNPFLRSPKNQTIAHEAGHAVVGRAVGYTLAPFEYIAGKLVRIRADGDKDLPIVIYYGGSGQYGGYCRHSDGPRGGSKAAIYFALAGHIAEAVWMGEPVAEYVETCFRGAPADAKFRGADGRVGPNDAHLAGKNWRKHLPEAEHLVRENWPEVMRRVQEYWAAEKVAA